MTSDAHHRPVLPLDEKLYRLDDAESIFFKQQTGIDDSDELKAHLLSIQATAYEVHPYPCIRYFSWARYDYTMKAFSTVFDVSRIPDLESRISSLTLEDLLKLGREREGAILLDIGCCLGTDVRKAILDGFPLKNVITTDLHKEFWDIGHKLFKTTPDTFPVMFVPGNVFDAEHLSIVPPFMAGSPPTTTVPDLRTLTSLNPLHGHVSAIYASQFFHLFPEDAQVRLARALAGLLSTKPGSMIFGIQVGLPESGDLENPMLPRRIFCHSPQSWSELWDGEVFPKGTVKISAFVKEIPNDRETIFLHYLVSSVT